MLSLSGLGRLVPLSLRDSPKTQIVESHLSRPAGRRRLKS